MSFGEEFTYATLRDELVIGEVYVRVYNLQPTFVLEVRMYVHIHVTCMYMSPSPQDAKGLADSLLDFIGSNAQYLHSLIQMTSSDVDTSKQGQHADRLKHVEMSLDALYNVIHNNAGVEIQCIGHFKLLFSLLGIQGASKLQHLALKVSPTQFHSCLCSFSFNGGPFQVISSVTGNKKCVSNISDANVLQYLLLVLYMLPTCECM